LKEFALSPAKDPQRHPRPGTRKQHGAHTSALCREKIELLNNLTDIITAWEESPRPTVQEVQKRFPTHFFR